MKKIVSNKQLVKDTKLITLRDCTISTRIVDKGRICNVHSNEYIHPINLSRIGFNVGACNGNPRLRLAYKNEIKLWTKYENSNKR